MHCLKDSSVSLFLSLVVYTLSLFHKAFVVHELFCRIFPCYSRYIYLCWMSPVTDSSWLLQIISLLKKDIPYIANILTLHCYTYCPGGISTSSNIQKLNILLINMKSFAILCFLLASCVSAHMEMSQPYPIRSPLNKNSNGPKDYSYTSPLSPSGSDFPCKGYANDPFQSVADYTAGQQYQMTISGGASHGGGSCQISLSYDKGQSYKVIHSMLGGCPLTPSYNFKIPSDAPSGEALLVWTWFNRIGNREMYMNCAQVTIHGASKKEKRTHPRDLLSNLARRTAFNDLPPIFVANVNGEGKCTTIEGQEVNFPLPGDSIEGSVSGKGYKCEGTAPFLSHGGGSSSENPFASGPGSSPPGFPGSKPSHPPGFGSNSPPAGTQGVFVPTSAVTANVTATAAPSPNDETNSLNTTSSTPVPLELQPESIFITVASSAPPGVQTSNVTTTEPVPAVEPTAVPSSNSSSVPPASGSCSQSSIICSPDGKSWSLCNNGSPVAMGSVAPGTVCRNGALVAA